MSHLKECLFSRPLWTLKREDPHLNLWIIPSCVWSQWHTQHKVLVLQRVSAASDNVVRWRFIREELLRRTITKILDKSVLLTFLGMMRRMARIQGWTSAGDSHCQKRDVVIPWIKSASKLQKRENKLRERERERETDRDRQTDRRTDLLLRNKSYPRYITQTSHIILHCVCFCINDTTDKQVCSLLYVYILSSSNYLNYWMK